MNKLSFSIFIVALSVGALVFSGCNNYLDVKPQGSILTQADYFKTADDAFRGTNACYSVLRKVEYSFGFYPITDIMSDDARKGSSPGDQAPLLNPYDNFTFTPSSPMPLAWYNTLYLGIRRCNAITDFVPTIAMDTVLRSRYLGEARCLRGSHYFDLVRGFGPVPLVVNSQAPKGLRRAAEQDIRTVIENDLLYAVNSLPLKSDYAATDLGRVSKETALSLLGRYYLWYKQYEKAEAALQQVVGPGRFGLEDDYSNAFLPAGNFGRESIWEVPSLGISENFESGGNQYAQVQGVRGDPNRGWGFNRPSVDLIATFEPGDSRLEKTVIRLGETLDGLLIKGDGETPDTIRENGQIVEIEVYNQKCWVPGSSTLEAWNLNRKLIRYADVLLMLAEALNEQGKSTDALPLIETVRARARDDFPEALPPVTETDKDRLREIILHERRVELALEGQRFFDLVRYPALSPDGKTKAEAVLGPLGFTKGKNELLPIPQQERDVTGNVIEQNPGY